MNFVQMFVMYYAGLVAMARHPGWAREGALAPSLRECAEEAVVMCRLTEEFVRKESGVCRGLAP